MAKVFDIRKGEAVGAQAKLGVPGVHVILAIARAEVAAICRKDPSQFVIDMFERSATLKGSIWIRSAGERPAAEHQRDWEVHCEFGDPADVERLAPSVTFQWIDALTVVKELPVGAEQRRWFMMVVQRPAEGVPNAIVEPQPLLC